MRPDEWPLWRSATEQFNRLQAARAQRAQVAVTPRRRVLPEIETGPLVAGFIVLGVPLLVWLALVLGTDGVRLGGLSFAVLVFGLFAWGFVYEVWRLSRLP